MAYKFVELTQYLKELDDKFSKNPDLWYKYILPMEKANEFKKTTRINIHYYGTSIAVNVGVR